MEEHIKTWYILRVHKIKGGIQMKKLVALVMASLMLVANPITVKAWTQEDVMISFFMKGNIASPLIGKTRIMSPFGHVRTGYIHQGIDVEAAMYTPVYAVADGVVTKASPDSKGVDKGGGHMIFIDHEDGTQSWYMHLSHYNVSVGDSVQAGALIGLSGDSGEVTAPHLHFEYRVGQVAVDPTFIFEMFEMFDTPTMPQEVAIEVVDFTLAQN